jgi:predicted DNA-binding ribbon-helix-helix protein
LNSTFGRPTASSKPSRRIVSISTPELQFAATGDLVGIGVLGVGDADGDVALGLAHQAGADHAGRDLVAFLAGERRVVDHEGHGQRRRIDRLRVDRRSDRQIAQRVGHGGVLHAGDGDDVARLGRVERHTLEAAKRQDARDARLLEFLAVAAQRLDHRIGLDRARQDAAGEDAAEEVVGFECRHQHAERGIRIDLRRRHMVHQQLEQRRHVRVLGLQRGRGPALAGRGEERREVELFVARIERDEQVEDLVMHLVGAHRRSILLIITIGFMPSASALREHEFGLRQRAFGGVASRIRRRRPCWIRSTSPPKSAWPGVSTMLMRVRRPIRRTCIGEDGDAPLAFEVVRVHGALGHLLVLAERAGLFQDRVDQRGFAVVDVRDDRDIADGVAAAGARCHSPVMRKRSVTIDGHHTSVSLEDAFWTELSALSQARGLSLNALVAEIDRDRRQDQTNLSSALRLHVLQELKRRTISRD